MIFMIGTDQHKPMEAWRYKLVSVTIKPFVRLHLLVSGVTKINYNLKKDVCYKNYLGEDWKAEYEGAGIQIANHSSWIDIMALLGT